MLILTMNIGKERYGIDSLMVSEILPLINLDQVPMVDKIIKGIFNYRGKPTPVIDLCQFFTGEKSNNNLGSRIIIINYQKKNSFGKPIGLIAERVTEVLKCDEHQLVSSGIISENTPFLGKIYKYKNDMIQLINVHEILPVSIAQQIFVDDRADDAIQI